MTLKLTRYDGSEIYESDIRPDNLQNLYWTTAEGIKMAVPTIPDSHLRNIALMLMGFGYTQFNRPDKLKILWLTALRMEWARRVPFTAGVGNGNDTTGTVKTRKHSSVGQRQDVLSSGHGRNSLSSGSSEEGNQSQDVGPT